MSRIRSIKPEWLEDERLALASPVARVMSVALITLADDEGRGRGNPTTLGGRVFPGSENPREDSRKALEELARLRYVVVYELDGQTYFQIRNWEKHQRVDKPSPSRLPAPPDDSAETKTIPATLTPPGNIREGSREIPEASRTFAPDLGPRTKDQDLDQSAKALLSESEPPTSDSPKLDAVKRVYAEWLREHVDPKQWAKCKLNGKRRRVIEARLRERYTPEQLIDAIRGVKLSRFHMGENPDGKRYTGIETILRDGAQVEKFESMLSEPPKPRSGMVPVGSFSQRGDSLDLADDLFGPLEVAHG